MTDIIVKRVVCQNANIFLDIRVGEGLGKGGKGGGHKSEIYSLRPYMWLSGNGYDIKMWIWNDYFNYYVSVQYFSMIGSREVV